MPTETEITESVFRSLVRMHGMFRNEMDRYFQSKGLSGAQWGVLRTLHRAEAEKIRGLTPGDLSRRMLVKAPSITGVIDRLERQGFVERVPSLQDLRSKQVRLTPEGRKSLEGVLKHHPAQMEKILSPLTGPQRVELQKLLGKIEAHLEHLAHPSSNEKKS